jgi:predicted nuclease of predicted toxin-antitoxin system
MILWVDAQLSPKLAPWLQLTFGVSALAVRDLGLRDAGDREIFLVARERQATIITKDRDFVHLVESLGPPPKIILLTCGNTSNAILRSVLAKSLPRAMEFLETEEVLVKIN